MLDYCVMSLGFIPYFTSRTFVPLFSAALAVQASDIAHRLVGDSTLALFGGAPVWLTSGWGLLILGLLALAEVVAGKSAEMRELTALVDSKTKATAAFALSLALAPSELQASALGAAEQGFSIAQSLEYVWAVLIGAGTWLCATMRGAIHGFLIEIDEEDDLGLQGFLSWLEDLVGFAGVFFVFIMPVLSLVVLGATVAGLWLTRRYLQRREDRSKVPCERCGTPFAPCGPHCPSCRQPRTLVRAVGILGTIKPTLATDLNRHTQELRAQKRCPSCGERLTERRLNQQCEVCLTPLFTDRAQLDTYLAGIREQLPRVLMVLLAVGLVPLLGLVVGVVYYRVSVIASLRCYLPRSTGFFARWGLRFVNTIILCFQPVPLLGMFTLPLMCLSNYMVYRALLEKHASVLNRPVPQPVAESAWAAGPMQVGD